MYCVEALVILIVIGITETKNISSTSLSVLHKPTNGNILKLITSKGRTKQGREEAEQGLGRAWENRKLWG